MLACGGSCVVIYLAGSILVQVFYRRTAVQALDLVNEVLGGVLGVLRRSCWSAR